MCLTTAKTMTKAQIKSAVTRKRANPTAKVKTFAQEEEESMIGQIISSLGGLASSYLEGKTAIKRLTPKK